MKGDELRGLVPEHKQDLARAEALVRLGYPAVRPILPQLLEWLQDYNWPVARVLAPLLAQAGAALSEPIRAVLRSPDDVWKYWVLSILVQPSADLSKALRDELQRLADSPTSGETTEGVTELAHEILSRPKA